MAVPFDKIKAPSKFSAIFSLRIETNTGALHWVPSGFKHPQQSISIQSNYRYTVHIITITMIPDIEVEFCFLTSTERISRCRKQEKVRPAPTCFFAPKKHLRSSIRAVSGLMFVGCMGPQALRACWKRLKKDGWNETQRPYWVTTSAGGLRKGAGQTRPWSRVLFVGYLCGFDKRC